MTKRLSVAIVVASLDRPESLAGLLQDLARQSEPAESIILSVTKTADLPDAWEAGGTVHVLIGQKGSCRQRNTALDHPGAASDIVLFCDDDYVPSRFMVERVRNFFAAHPGIAGASGRLIADGINGPGLSLAEARAMLALHDAEPAPRLEPVAERHGLYGCNMAFRRTAIGDIRFDERLPLYGWQEDIDFAAQIKGRGGRLVSTHGFAGVHCGVKRGRSSGLRLGYSQVVNPVYLARKGTMRPRYALRLVLRQFAANHMRSLRPEPWVDRMGRVRGNWLGLVDLMRGRITPERITRF